MDRARLRTTLTYQLLPSLSLGVEYNPLGDDVGPLANWRAIDETETTPALILGTSSDRIGTEEGRAVYGTLSKSLERETGLPIAPYAGIAWGGADDEWVGIGGLAIAWSERVTSSHMWDGYNLHHLVEYGFERQALGLVLVQQDDDYFLGLSWNVSFAMPWERVGGVADD